MGTTELTINGKVIDVDLDDLLVIKNVSSDMDRVAAHMSFWATVNAEAESEKVRVDTYYRKWRAKTGQALLKSDPKLAEWKVRQLVDAQPKFDALKEAIARSVSNATVTRGIYESLRTKANMLQSKGAMMRAELDATGMHTPSSSKQSGRAAVKEQDRAGKVTKMKGLKLKKPKAKKGMSRS